MSQRDLVESYRHCRAVTRTYARSFSFASHVLPAAKRRGAYAVYAFCRYADDAVDEATAGAAAAVDRLRAELDDVYAGRTPPGPGMPAFRDTVERYAIPQSYFLDLLRGVEMDLRRSSFDSFRDLRDYCYHVASVVGLIMTRIFGVSDNRAPARAVDLGLAMQLTNILRDLAEDHRRGRCYLPREEMERFGYTVDDLSRGRITPAFHDLMRFQIDRARGYYRSADLGLPSLTGDGSRFCVRLMARTYEAILDVIEERGYDVFSRRASTSLSRKLGIAAACLFTPLPAAGGAGDLPSPFPPGRHDSA